MNGPALLVDLRIDGEAGTAGAGRWRTLDGCGPAEMERIARDAGVSAADLSILAGKWPDAADLLYRRMNEIKLARMEVTHADPQVMRDLQRVCTVCGSKRRCEHELAKNPSDLAKILPERYDALGIGRCASCQSQGELDGTKIAWSRPRVRHRAGRLSFTRKQPSSRPNAGSSGS